MGISNNPYVSKVLTNFVQERQQTYGDAGYIASTIMPWLPVKGKTGTYYTANRTFFNQLPTNYTQRGTKDPTQGLPDWSVTTATYSTSDFALAAETARADLDQTEPELITRQTEVQRVQDALMLQHELSVHSLISDSTIYSTNNVQTGASSASTNQFVYWDDANGTPLTVIEDQIARMMKENGIVPNCLIIPNGVWNKLKFNTKFLTPQYQVQLNIATIQYVKDVFPTITTVLIPTTTYDTAAPGGTASMSWVWGNEAYLGFLQGSPSRRARAFGYTFTQTDLDGGAPSEGFRVRSYVDEGRGRGVYVDIIEAVIDRKICDADTFTKFATPVNPSTFV